jgi:hypothetical protein
MAMSTDRDDAPARRYREASAALDERPSAATRAAILAAAARQVEARPQAADAPRLVRRRWPLAAAAAVLLSTLAVMMADRTGQEMPASTAPAERAQESVAVAPATAGAPTPPPESAVPMPAPPIAAAPAPIAQRSTSSDTRDGRSSSAAVPAERVDAQRSDAASPAVSARSAERAPEAPSAEARQELSTAAPAPRGAAHLDAARDFEGSAPMWLERIVKLRREGREAEADAELKRFRERYPDVHVPPAALPGVAAGTR